MEIIWKEIPNFEKFSINQYGEIRNNQTDRRMVFYLKISKERKDYRRYRVTLTDKNKVKNYYVHKLVAELHVPNPNNYKRILFIDNNPLNVESSNLRWISDNEFKAIHEDNHVYDFYGNTPKPIVAKHLVSEHELEFDSLTEAGKVLNTKATYINRVIRGIQSHHKGYTFRYKDVTM